MGIEHMIQIGGFYLLTVASITRGGEQICHVLAVPICESNFSAIDFYARINKNFYQVIEFNAIPYDY